MDALLPFLLNEKPIRGRLVRLQEAVDTVLRQHVYPERISHLLGETLVMAAILSSNLKGGGIFTIQLQSKGGLSLLVADADASGALRGYAQFDAAADLTQPLSDLCRDGYLAITLDTGDAASRYQGVVPLEGESVAASIQHYFTQSQQLQVKCKIAVGQYASAGQMRWVAGGLYIEHMPESAEASGESESWREASILLETVKEEELLDTQLAGEQLLYRLFHEDGVWVYDAHNFRAQCRCSRAKIHKVLAGMESEALAKLADAKGEIAVDCQFCGGREIFAAVEFEVAGK